MRAYKNLSLSKVILFYTGIAGVAWGWISLADLECKVFGFKGIPEAFVVGFIIFALSLQTSNQFQWAKDLENIFSEALTPLSLPSIFLISLFSSSSEELLFRGAIQNQFGLAIASLLFGLVHMPLNKKLIPWTLSATIMGFILGGLYIYAGNLGAPILLHFLINFLNIWMINQKNTNS